MNLLTQTEVADLLRCSVSKVERLRREGALPYLPGRPVMIELADVLAHVERQKARSRLLAARKAEPKTSHAAATQRAKRAVRKLTLKKR